METANAAGKFLDPEAIIKQLGIMNGNAVADFGCGPGYFSIPFANVVGKDGRVYAFDVLPQALESVESKAKLEGLSNIVTKRVNLESLKGTKLEDSCVDWVILKDVLFQNQKKEIMLGEAYRILKPGGKAIIIEWNQGELAVGPGKELRISPLDLRQMLESQHFRIEKDIDAGNFHFAFIAEK
jgi:ubiquinone/menaquinone biosynthesis C-methylase UbiE